jgi:hypothetical protein
MSTDGRDKTSKTQKTQPAKGKPIEIPVPKREDIEQLLKRAAKPKQKPVPKTAKDIYGESWIDRS